jgi:phosphatidylinositol alpha-1,6-mannosyltransferase
VVDPGDVGEIVARIASLLSSPALAARMGAAGRRWVSADHATGRSASVLAELLALDA